MTDRMRGNLSSKKRRKRARNARWDGLREERSSMKLKSETDFSSGVVFSLTVHRGRLPSVEGSLTWYGETAEAGSTGAAARLQRALHIFYLSFLVAEPSDPGSPQQFSSFSGPCDLVFFVCHARPFLNFPFLWSPFCLKEPRILKAREANCRCGRAVYSAESL